MLDKVIIIVLLFPFLSSSVNLNLPRAFSEIFSVTSKQILSERDNDIVGELDL